MRQRYGLNYVQISKILSFGPNQYSQYENGQIPSDSDGRILAAVRNKQSMLIFLENARNELGEKEYLALRKSIASSKEDDKDWRIPLFFQGTYKSLNNGYVTPSAEKLEQVVRFFVSREGSVFPTKLNKKLFYADFLHFKHHGQGITGLEYKAVQHGPLPAHYNTIYDNILGIESEIVLSRGMECGKFSCNGFNGSFFQKNELGTLETVAGKCVQMTTSEIISASHKEPAWMNNHHSRAAGPWFAITGLVVQDDGARFRKVLSEYVLPEALQRGVGRQRGSWEALMSGHALPYALLCSLARQGSARHFFRTV